ncbi:hypothetical protein QKW35_01895 [Pontibacterium granulatum]|uniref:hypothetical protein n=1 Tax=Pontibacterium granulatum TaxID=2036029 RepID=UPI00249C97D3|nr:hypothetical protein [Pontibacterium granulatum]MDI3323116.1 hypothetical protein [Pontibacterium granulatum]
MGGIQWFILIVIVLAGLALYNWKASQNQLAALQKQGFNISDDLKGQPNLLVDSQARELAVVTAKGFQRYGFDQVAKVELRFDQGVQTDEKYRVHISFNGAKATEINYENEWLAKEQQARLQDILQ